MNSLGLCQLGWQVTVELHNRDPEILSREIYNTNKDREKIYNDNRVILG